MFLKPKEFAIVVGVSYNTLKQHFSRKKVFKSDGHVDTEYELNKIYIEKQTKGKGLNLSLLEEKEEVTQEQSVPSEAPKPIDHVPQFKSAPKPQKEDSFTKLDKRKKLAEIDKTERDVELKQLQIEKILGQLAPVELIEKILSVNMQHIFKTFENECTNIASEYSEILGGDRNAIADMTKKMRESVKRIVSTTKKKSKQDIEVVISEYATTRNRGEKK